MIGVFHRLEELLEARFTRRRTQLAGGQVLSHRLLARYRDHDVELLASSDLMIVDVSARFGQFTLMVINPRPRRYPYRSPAFSVARQISSILSMSLQVNLPARTLNLSRRGRSLDSWKRSIRVKARSLTSRSDWSGSTYACRTSQGPWP